jgi:tetratricopeptide (TPR) repeat protein
VEEVVNRAIVAVIAAVLLLAACGRDREQPEPQAPTVVWYTSFDEAKADAQQDGDLILLSFEARWCPWSRLMRESLYVSNSVVESLATLRCVRVDVDRDTNLVREFGIVLYPAAVVADAYGCEIGRMTGYHTPEEFLARLGHLKKREDELADMFKQEETLANDPTFLITFGKMLVDIGMYDGALIRFDRARQIDEDDRFGTLEEATYSLAECYMLAGEYKEAGRRFRLFAEAQAGSERAEEAAVLAALCYQKVDYNKVATGIYEDYLENFSDGEFAQFVRARLDSLKAGKQ